MRHRQNLGRRQKQSGFTLVELLIATLVFSTIVLIATTGLLYIGRAYYKGIISGKTQEVTRSITKDISNAYQFNSSSGVTTQGPVGFGGLQVSATCIGNYRFTYTIGVPVRGTNDADTNTTQHALWLDVINNGATCAPLDLNNLVPQDANTNTSAEAIAQRRELLPQNARLAALTFNESPNRTFLSFTVSVVYGDLDVSPGNVCVPNSLGGSFCAVSSLNTTVKKRL